MSIDTYINGARTSFDLTNPSHRESVRDLAEVFVNEKDVESLEAKLKGAGVPLEARMAGLLARSRRWVEQCRKPVKAGVVFAMWGEHHRLKPKSAENVNGENSLAAKLEQLEWATRDSPIEWHLYAVDDGCPHGSAGNRGGASAGA